MSAWPLTSDLIPQIHSLREIPTAKYTTLNWYSPDLFICSSVELQTSNKSLFFICQILNEFFLSFSWRSNPWHPKNDTQGTGALPWPYLWHLEVPNTYMHLSRPCLDPVFVMPFLPSPFFIVVLVFSRWLHLSFGVADSNEIRAVCENAVNT